MGLPRIDPEAGSAVVFGYGSLLSVPSVERSLGRPYAGPFHVANIRGWRRSWDVVMPNEAFYLSTDHGPIYPKGIVYLNVRRDRGSLLNGTVFTLSDAELRSMDRREWIYRRVDVRPDLGGVDITGGEVWAYVGRDEFIVKDVSSLEVAAIRSSYLQMLEAGLRQFDTEFRDSYERSTDPLPTHLVIDDVRDRSAPDPFGYPKP